MTTRTDSGPRDDAERLAEVRACRFYRPASPCPTCLLGVCRFPWRRRLVTAADCLECLGPERA